MALATMRRAAVIKIIDIIGCFILKHPNKCI